MGDREMTNGEKIKEIFPNAEYLECEVVMDVVFARNQENWFDLEWWNAEYKEPTTKNDLPHCNHTDEEIAKSFIEDVEAVKDLLLAKNDLADERLKQNIQAYVHDFGVSEEQAEKELQVTTKNDLAVDCISRADAIRVASGYCHPSNVAKELAKLPSVTPQEPMTVPIAKIKYDEDKLKELISKCVLTVTPQPRKGHWIDEGVYADGQGYHSFMCSECEWHLIEYKNMLIDYKHCPFCGAPMREVEE